jgi:hypothetical protein
VIREIKNLSIYLSETSSRNIISQALRELHRSSNVTVAPSNCNRSGNLWQTGITFFEFIRRQILAEGLTGRVAFDAMGDRINAEYRVINVQRNSGGGTGSGRESVVGHYRYSKVSKQPCLPSGEFLAKMRS